MQSYQLFLTSGGSGGGNKGHHGSHGQHHNKGGHRSKSSRAAGGMEEGRRCIMFDIHSPYKPYSIHLTW